MGDMAGEASLIFGNIVGLGPILSCDIADLFRWSDDAEEARRNEVYRPQNWQRQEDFWLNTANDGSRIFFAVRAKGDPSIIGFVQITHIDPVHRSATIGVRIGDAHHRRQGKGREALSLAVAYCWNSLNLTRLALAVFAENAQAMALYCALGFEREGVLQKAMFIDGQWVDVVLMALLHPQRSASVNRAEIAGRP